MKYTAILVSMALVLAAACGGSGDGHAEDTSGGQAEEGGTMEALGGDVGEEGEAVPFEGDETICRVNMEALSMMLLTVKGSRGSLPGSLEEFQSISPAYAEMTVECGGTPYIYATDGQDFTITCPNGHGYITNDQPGWSW